MGEMETKGKKLLAKLDNPMYHHCRYRRLYMKTTVQKWGNSYAVRIPKSFIKEVGLEYRADVELSLEDGKLIIQPIKEKVITLDELLDGVTSKNLHTAVGTGDSVGNETW
jgi:antitoxin MazE